MYIPEHFEERDLAVLQTLVRAHPLGTWVSEVNGVLEVNHLPFIIDDRRGEFGTLVGHVARANAVWKVASSRVESVVVFQGPQGYITPSWYPSKHDHGRVVPTWNYAVVHAHGTPRVVDDRAWLLRHVTELTSFHESGRETPWQVSDAPTEFIEGLVKGIVGIEIPIARLTGKWKVSQNRSVPDRLGVAAGLQTAGDKESQQMAQLVQERTNRTTEMRRLISSGSPFEPRVGVSRAVRVGSVIAVSGTAPLGPDGRTVGIGDPAAQTRRCLQIIKEALERAGASLEQVVRTRTLLTRIEDWEAVASVHGEFFGMIRPANTIMQVSRFIDPDWLVELEADAIADSETSN